MPDFSANHPNLPIREDEAGTWRVGNSRVLLDLVVEAFDQGEVPEEIICRYRTLTLADTYGAIAWVLKHRAVTDAYLVRRRELALEVRDKIERSPEAAALRARQLARGSSPPSST